ncbi:alpha/beta fold hydrolase [Bacillus piscicola]|uniref:alpha/beta fold hydrolase n=1 Tax=Bacillus piscicola TaxID=1632684 RepID=UPI001F09E138|nr:alpha/beta hydrolase [Bacillus piscicola]
MPFFSSQGATIHYEVRGEGPPLLFVHPPSMGAATFMGQHELTKSYQVICMNARGHGQSSNGKGTLTIEEWARDTYNLVKELQLEKVIIAGYSCGGSVALEFALNWPERTAGIVLAGGFPEVSSTLLRKEFETGIWIAENELMGLLAQILSFSNSTNKEHRRAIAETVRHVDPHLVASMYESGLEYTCTSRLPNLRVPVLLLYGIRDWYVHYYQYLFFKHAQQAELDVVCINSVGHQIPTLEAHAFNAVVERFANAKLPS